MEVKRETATTSKKPSAAESPLQLRIGHGFDIQKLVSAYPWVIGGQYIRYSLGCEAYPKADVLYQSVVDAILGALGLPDAEEMFPWFDPKWDGASSSVFVAEAVRLMNDAGYEIGNLDTTLILREPYLQLSAIKETIKTNLSRILGVDVSVVSFKSKAHRVVDSNDINVSAHCVVLLVRK